MPLYMDVHELGDRVTLDAVAQADLQTQEKYDVRYLRYWVNKATGRVSAWSRRRPQPPRPTSTAERSASSRRK